MSLSVCKTFENLPGKCALTKKKKFIRSKHSSVRLSVNLLTHAQGFKLPPSSSIITQ